MRHVISSVAHSVLLLLLLLLVVMVMVLVVLMLMLRALCRRRRRLPVSALHARKLLKAALLQRAQDVAHGERRGVFWAQGHDSAPHTLRDWGVLALRKSDTTVRKRKQDPFSDDGDSAVHVVTQRHGEKNAPSESTRGGEDPSLSHCLVRNCARGLRQTREAEQQEVDHNYHGHFPQ